MSAKGSVTSRRRYHRRLAERVRRVGRYSAGWDGLSAGAPAPPNLASLLFDWDPAWSPYQDRKGGIQLVPSGTAPTPGVANGRQCMVFGGAGALVATSSPFAALSDLSGGVSVYVVAERTDVNATQMGLVSIDDTANSPASTASSIFLLWNNFTELAYCSVYDPSNTNVTAGQAVAVNQVTVTSIHATLTARTAKVDGVGSAEASGTSLDPASLDRFVIGSIATASLTQYFVGRIYRVLVCEGAYNEDVLTYLQGLYSPARIPPGVASSDVLFLWDPAASYTRDWAGSGQTLTPNGAITQTVRAGHPCAEFAADTAYYEGVAPFAAFADVVPVTHIAVGEIQSGSAGALSLYLSSGGLTANSFYAFLRATGGGVGFALWAPATQDYSGSPVATVGKVHSLIVSVESSLLTAYMDGAGNAGTAHATSPASLTTLRIGSAGTQAAAGTFAPSRWYYQALLRGSYSAAELHAWLAATFPVGETP